VGSTHAFAGGRVYERPSVLSRLVGVKGARAWRTFERRAVVGKTCLLGPSAWCFNEGPREQVLLHDGVVCRGLLRRESFGDGIIEIGERAYIGDDCIVSCAARVEIGAYVLLGHGVQIFDNDSHPLDAAARAEDWQAILAGGRRPPIGAAPVRLESHTWVGAGSFVLKGVTVGTGAVIGAGSVVTKDVPAGSIAMGNPARVMYSRDTCEDRG
jgi:acetyltransferase-like isoleucine patch superfamily enzyme